MSLPPEPTTAVSNGDVAEADLATLRVGLACDEHPTGAVGDPTATFCNALTAFEAGTPAPGNESLTSFVGASAIIRTSPGHETVFEASYFIVGEGKAKCGTISPENAEERRQAGEIVGAVVAGRSLPANDAVAYGRSRSGATATTDVVGRSLRWTNPIRGFARSTDMGIVVVEEAVGGWFVGIFPVR